MYSHISSIFCKPSENVKTSFLFLATKILVFPSWKEPNTSVASYNHLCDESTYLRLSEQDAIAAIAAIANVRSKIEALLAGEQSAFSESDGTFYLALLTLNRPNSTLSSKSTRTPSPLFRSSVKVVVYYIVSDAGLINNYNPLSEPSLATYKVPQASRLDWKPSNCNRVGAIV
jgi:hypothetical protein